MKRIQRIPALIGAAIALMVLSPILVLGDATTRIPAQGQSGITSGVTAISGGGTTQVCFNSSSTLVCGDSDFTFSTDTATVTKLVVGSAAGADNAVEIGTTANTITFNDPGSAFTMKLTHETLGANRVMSLPNAISATLAHVGTTAQVFTGDVIINPSTASLGGHIRYGVNAVTTTATTAATTSGDWYTNTGDADGATVTLMNDPTQGGVWYFAVTVAQTLTIAPSAGETLKHGSTTCATSLTSNTVGSTIGIATVVGGAAGSYYTFGATGSWTCS